MLRTARDKDAAVANHRCDEAAERAANMTLGVDVGVVEHGVAMARDPPAPIGLAFDEHRAHARTVLRRNLWSCCDAEIAKRLHDTADIERVRHRAMGNAQ